MHSASASKLFTLDLALSQLKTIGIKILRQSVEGEELLECRICFETENLNDQLQHFVIAGCCGKTIHLGCDIEAYRSSSSDVIARSPFESHKYKCVGCHRPSLTIEYQMQLRALSTYITTSLFVYLNIPKMVNLPRARKLFLLVQQEVVLEIINRHVDLQAGNDSMAQLQKITDKAASFFEANSGRNPSLDLAFYNTATLFSAQSLVLFERMSAWYDSMPVDKKVECQSSKFDAWIKEMFLIKQDALERLTRPSVSYSDVMYMVGFFSSVALILENSLVYMLDHATLDTPFNGFRLTSAETAQLSSDIKAVLSNLGALQSRPVGLKELDEPLKRIARSMFQVQQQNRYSQLYNFKLPSAPARTPVVRLDGEDAQVMAAALGLHLQGVPGRNEIPLTPEMVARLRAQLNFAEAPLAAPPQKGSLDWLSWPILLGMLAFSIAYLIYEQNNLPPR